MLEPGALLQNRYTVVRPIGKGGMGSVYLAHDQRLNTKVALKETLYTDEHYRHAFEQEAQILARLRHQHLPRVLDHFIEDRGQFLVMEFIDGEDLGSELERHRQRFATPQAMPTILRWADQLLDALQYLHSRPLPVFHRDIKPRNLKYTPSNEIVLLDFGLARGGMTITVDPDAGAPITPRQRVYGFTAPYAPIEQMSDEETDARGDLYALAATIYHLLTAAPPADASMRTQRLLNGKPDPLRPIRDLAPHVPAPVAALIERALAITAEGRPASAREMRVELAPWLVPVSAGTPAGAAPQPQAPNGAPPLPPAGAATPAREQPSPASTPRIAVTASPIRALAFHPAGGSIAVGYKDQRVELLRSDDLRSFAIMRGHRSGVRCVRFAPGGDLLASASDDESVRIWRADDGALQREFRLPDCRIESLAFSPDGATLAVGGWGKAITLCDLRSSRVEVAAALPAPFVQCLSFSPDGATLAAGDYNGLVNLWAMADYSPGATLGGFAHPVYAVAFSPDGVWLAASSNRSVRVWRTADLTLVDQLQGHAGPIHSLAFSPNSQTLATASEDRSVRFWRVSDWSALPRQLEHRAGVASVAYSPDGATLAAGCHDGRLYLWRIAGYAGITPLPS